MFERIVFLQGDEADEALAILDTSGEEDAIAYLAHWHYPGEHETADEPARGTADDWYESEGYILSWNRGLGYIGLEFCNG